MIYEAKAGSGNTLPACHTKRLTKTEKIAIFSDTMAVTLTALTVAVIFLHNEYAYQMGALAGLWIAEASIFHALYAWKERRANSQKYMQDWVERVADKYGAELAARYAEIVLQNSNQ